MKYFLRTIVPSLTFFLLLGIIPFIKVEGSVRAVPYSEERDEFEALEDSNKQDVGLPTNPMELMRLLEKYSSINKATTPSDAIDEALEIFNEESDQSSSINN